MMISFIMGLIKTTASANSFLKCLNDGTPDVRDAAFSALTTVAKFVGMRPLERSLEKLDDVRKKKHAEMIAGSGSAMSGGVLAQVVVCLLQSLCSFLKDHLLENQRQACLVGKGLFLQHLPTRKGLSVKSVNNKKVDGVGRLEIAKLTVPPEDIEPAEMNLEEIESRLRPSYRQISFLN